MIRTFGAKRQHSPGLLAPIHWPDMASLDEWTSDGRRLSSGGGGSRELPVTVYFQFAQSMAGHDGAVAVGALDYVVLDDEEGKVKGDGWLIDSPEARAAHVLISTGALARNSLDLADYRVEIEWTEDYDILVDFVEWSVGATTFVGKSAFPDAHGEVGEIVASLAAKAGDIDPTVPLVIDAPVSLDGDRFTTGEREELTAAAGPVLPGDDFFRPEPDEFCSWTVDEDGAVFGHLGLWSSCHTGFEGVCRTIPRSRSGYREFMQSGPLVEFGDGRRRQIETGPVFLAGGHVTGLSPDEVAAAYGGVENTWADVRVIDGKLGPWVCGRIRPGLTEEQIHAARCSRISGHWINGALYAIVSVNAEGFNVPGKGTQRDFATVGPEGAVVEMVASAMGPCCDDCADHAPAPQPESPPTSLAQLLEDPENRRQALELLADDQPADPATVEAIRARFT